MTFVVYMECNCCCINSAFFRDQMEAERHDAYLDQVEDVE